jgi:hypothetical protein
MNLADLAVDPRAEADLSWRWTYADGEMGLASNFAPIVARLECGGRTGGKPIIDIPEHQVRAASRARRIDRALEDIGAQRAAVLRACFGPTATQLRGLGFASGVAPLTLAARRAWVAYRASISAPGPDVPSCLEAWLVRLCDRASRSGARGTDRALVLEIRREAEAAALASARAYSAARRVRR